MCFLQLEDCMDTNTRRPSTEKMEINIKDSHRAQHRGKFDFALLVLNLQAQLGGAVLVILIRLSDEAVGLASLNLHVEALRSFLQLQVYQAQGKMRGSSYVGSARSSA